MPDFRSAGGRRMSRARTLSPEELRHLLDHLARRRHALRNTTIVLLTYWAGLRVGEVAALQYGDIVDPDRRIRAEVELRQGSGRAARTVLLSSRLRQQLAVYINAFPPDTPSQPLFYTQKRAGWTPNTLAQHLFHLYRAAGIRGASSQSGRRTFVATLARRGVKLGVVRDLAGHRRLAATRAAMDTRNPVRDFAQMNARETLDFLY